jgi:hypothetical protein
LCLASKLRLIEACNLNVTNNALFQADNNVIITASRGKGYANIDSQHLKIKNSVALSNYKAILSPAEGLGTKLTIKDK